MARVVQRPINDDGNAFLEGILWKKTTASTITAWEGEIRIAFKNTSSNSWTSTEKNFFLSVLDQWTDVTKLKYDVTSDPKKANMIETIMPQKFFGSDPENITLGAHETPEYGSKDLTTRGWYWNDMFDSAPIGKGSLVYSTVLHELGHALGLAHPHDTGGGSSVFADQRYNHTAYTIMSYNEAYAFKSNGKIVLLEGSLGGLDQARGQRIDPAAFDIEAIQKIYGVKQSHTGDNTYYLNDKHSYWTTPWDTGGTDTLRYDGDKRAVIDLRPASMKLGASDAGGGLSYVEDVLGGVTMASNRTVKTAVIENATGGNGNDTITGNGANNLLYGRGGDDVINGGGNGKGEGDGDIVYYRGSYSDYDATVFVGGAWIEQVKNTKKFDDGFDRVRGVEIAYFAKDDQAYSLEWSSSRAHARAGGQSFDLDGGNLEKLPALLLGFVSGKDTIVLKDALFDDLDSGRLDADEFVLGHKARDGNDHLIFDAGDRALYYDADGAGGDHQVLVAAFGVATDLSARDVFVA
jgi:Ca2+-binding RTX toxin-like protein